MQITRIYDNTDGATLRVDRITINLTPPIGKTYRIGNDPGLQMSLGPQTVETTIMGSASSRVVANVELTGSYNDWDTAGPPYNITWASKTIGSGQVIKFDMSALPVIGDTI